MSDQSGPADAIATGETAQEQPGQRQPEPPARTKAQEIAEILNEPDIQFVPWEELMGEGVVVRLHIKRVRFRKKLTFEDLGLHFASMRTQQAMADVFRLGMKNLLPGEYIRRLETIESTARKLLQRSSYDTVWGPFIPVTGYQAWREKNQELMDAYYKERDLILQNYADLKKEVIASYTEAARNAYRILNKLDPQVLSEREKEREAFYLAGVRRKIRRMLPSVQEITDSFDFVVSPTYIDLPLLLKDQALPGKSVLEKQTIEGVTLEEQRELRWLQAGTRQRQEMMREMNRDVVQKAREQKERQIDDFLTTIISQLRALIYDAATNVLAALKKHGTMPPRSVVQLKNLVEQISLLNFYNDRDASRIMNMIRDLIDQPREKRDLDVIEQRLREIATVMRASLITLEYEFLEDRQEREDGEEAAVEREKRLVADVARKPSRQEVREARLSLGLSVPTWDDHREERMQEEGSQNVLLQEEERQERTWS